MFLDRLYAFRKRRKGYTEPKVEWGPEINSFDQSKVIWLCFFPKSISKNPFLREGFIPREGQVVVYTMSSFDIITPFPEETVEKLERIYADALEKMQTAIQQGYTICLLGISLGNVVSIRLASQAKIKTLVSIVGGAELGLSGWDSILTGHIARQSACTSAEEYERKLFVFSPTHYVGGIEAEKVIIRLGTHDQLIHFKHGKRLAEAFIERSRKTSMQIDYKVYPFADHIASVILASLECRRVLRNSSS